MIFICPSEPYKEHVKVSHVIVECRMINHHAVECSVVNNNHSCLQNIFNVVCISSFNFDLAMG